MVPNRELSVTSENGKRPLVVAYPHKIPRGERIRIAGIRGNSLVLTNKRNKKSKKIPNVVKEVLSRFNKVIFILLISALCLGSPKIPKAKLSWPKIIMPATPRVNP